ncbi:MAG: helix-turn-helix transcriptional regulator [Friedmanniella sp.]
MSSIRLFILDALARHGEMHGHQLRLLAEQEHVHLWTDISVGALYGAIKRLAGEGLLAEARTERSGGYPERQVYRITDAGRASLADLQAGALAQVVFKPDPFDLALSRSDPNRLDQLADAVAERLRTLQALLAETELANNRARPYLSVAERHALQHREHRLRAEIGWHEELLADIPAVVADERARALAPDPLPTTPAHSEDHSHD